MLLHTVNKSAFDSSALADCLRVVATSDAVLLIENGVYAALNSPQSGFEHSESIAQLSADGTRFYVLQADCEARGLDDAKLAAPFEIIDDAGFVALAAAASAIQSWY
ncbi:MAG: sulfurtransferase complex subunit TusB [Gammaproteobacteria bacterium]|nr:sulfurtransferase complex subunit TusB [Gammaproteobacteria bacterium]MBQ0838753.1 sulfurtransferase complex subunit TusB [Gammaproteobacteria bacterium]